MVLVWLVSTAGVTYVANAAVELVDLQVFPQGARIEVLARAQSTPTTSPLMRATTTVPTTTTVAASVTIVAATTTMSAPTTVAPTTIAPVTTTVVPTITAAGTPATTTLPAATTTGSPTTSPPATSPPATTTRPPVATTTTTTTTTTIPVQALAVATDSLPEARVGENYQELLTALGGRPPYSWSLASGTLPDGLSLSSGGVLSGIPSSSYSITISFNVSDMTGRSASSPELEFITTADRRMVAARGGTVFVDVVSDSVSLFLASPADGFSAIVVESGGFRVEVQFVPLQGDATSWVVCEVAGSVECTHG